MSLLISKEDFKAYIHLTDLIDSFTKVMNWIRWVQEKRLKPKLGEAFYEEILAKQNEAAYKPLVEKIRPYLVWRSMVQITKLNDYNFSSYGVVKKKNRDMSEGITSEERRELIREFQQYADDAEREFLAYLDEHKEDFELWKSGDDSCKDDDERRFNISISAI